MSYTIKINEIFFSIQGESLLVGKPTVFIRTATCNLRCTWCDTRYSFWQGKVMNLDEVMQKVDSFKAEYVCLTGGEPLGQRSAIPLMERLLKQGYTVSLETNGAFSIAEVPKEVIKVIDLKCPDSGESGAMVWENLKLAQTHDQFKFVVASKADFDWAAELCERERLHQRFNILYSPVFGKVKAADLADWILNSNPKNVTMQTQMHKEIWGPNQRGV